MSETTKSRPAVLPTGGSNPSAGSESNRVSVPLMNRLAARPEIGALLAAIVIYIAFFAIAPSFRGLSSLSLILYSSAGIGIVAVAVGLLMVGGEFDLSAGVAAITSGLTASMVSYNFNANMVVGTGVSLVLALVIGFINGYLVVKTRIPSFLVTLGTFFVLQGANLGVTKLVTGTVSTQDVSNIGGFSFLHGLFAADINLGTITSGGVSRTLTLNVLVIWWLIFAAIAAWILVRTRLGNWILAAGGNAESARAVGVPVDRVKIGLFMGVGFLAWFYGQHTLYAFNTLQSGNGVGNEFIYIIAAVVGGTLLTGGYGSAIGVAIGAFIFGMVTQGIVFAGWDPNWFKAFLGVMLLLAVAVNLWVRKLSTKRKA